MPVNETQLTAASQWFFPGGDFEDRINFLWDGLTAPQQSALVARIKSDLDAEFDAKIASTQAKKTDTTGSL